jgi:hypothetical protein
VKLEALESVIAPKLRTGGFKATDKLIEMLKADPNMRCKKHGKMTAEPFQRMRCPHKNGLRIKSPDAGLRRVSR